MQPQTVMCALACEAHNSATAGPTHLSSCSNLSRAPSDCSLLTSSTRGCLHSAARNADMKPASVGARRPWRAPRCSDSSCAHVTSCSAAATHGTQLLQDKHRSAAATAACRPPKNATVPAWGGRC